MKATVSSAAAWTLLALLAVNVSANEAITIAHTNRTLIFSDNTSGTMHETLLWRMLAESEGAAPVVLDSQLRFMEELASEGWGRVVVLAQYTGTELVLTEELRLFTGRNPNALIYLIIWTAPAGTRIEAGVPAVFATRSLFFWNQGRTYATFIDGAWRENPELDPRVLVGHVFPDFSAVEVAVPQPAGAPAQILVANTSGRGAGGLGCECGGEACPCCNVCWIHALNVCNNTQDTSTANCQAAYGPGGTAPNPDQLAACVNDANTNHTACVKNASTQFKACRVRHNCDNIKK